MIHFLNIKIMNFKTIMTTVLFASVALGAGAQDLKSGLKMSNLDQNVRPQDDFYEYACGGWMKNNPLPAAYSRYGSFDQLQEDNDKRINGILDELKNGTYTQGTIEQKLSDFYKLAMDQKRRNKEGVQPVPPAAQERRRPADRCSEAGSGCGYGCMDGKRESLRWLCI